MDSPSRALVLTARWLNLVLDGTKSIHIRGGCNTFSGRVYLLESKTGRVRGQATVGAARDLTPEEFEDEDNKAVMKDKKWPKPQAWPLSHVVALDEVWLVSGRARLGCNIWVPRRRWEEYPVAAPPPRPHAAERRARWRAGSIRPRPKTTCNENASSAAGAATPARRVATPRPTSPERALKVKARWLNLILEGKKTVEIRSHCHSFAGHPIYLLETKTGRVRGRATLGAARDLTPEEMEEHKEALTALKYPKPRAWPLTDVARLEREWIMSGEARQSSVIWVKRRRWEEYPAAA